MIKITKIIYNGDNASCNVNVLGARFIKWKKGEEKEVCPRIAAELARNKDFKITEITKYKDVKKAEPKKEEVKIEEKKEEEVKPEIKSDEVTKIKVESKIE